MKSNNPITTTTIGIDLGDAKHQVCVLDQAGNIREEFSLPGDKAGLLRMPKRFPDAAEPLEERTPIRGVVRLRAASGMLRRENALESKSRFLYTTGHPSKSNRHGGKSDLDDCG